MKRIQFFLISIIILSTLLIIISIENLRAAYFYKTENQIKNDSISELNNLVRDSNEVYTIQKELNKYYVLLLENNYSLKELDNLHLNFNNKGYNFIKIHFFNDKSDNIAIKNNNEKNNLAAVIQRLYSALATYKNKNDDTLLKRYKSLFQTLLGFTDLTKLANETSTLVPVSFNGKPGYIYWNYYETTLSKSNINGFIAWFKSSDIPSEKLLQNTIDRYNSNKSLRNYDYTFGFIDTLSQQTVYPDSIFEERFKTNKNDLLIKLQEMKSFFKISDNFAKHIISFNELSNEKTFFCLVRNTKTNLTFVISIIFDFILIIICCFLCLNLYKLQYVNSGLRGKYNQNLLIFLFVYIFVVSTFLFYINNFINDYNKENQKSHIYNNLNSLFDWLNKDFILQKENIKEKWLSLAQKTYLKNIETNLLDSEVKSMTSNHLLNKVFITNNSGKILYSYPKEKDGVFNKIIPVIGRRIASSYSETEESWQNKIDSLMLESIDKNFNDLLGDNNTTNILKAFEKINSISEIELGNKKHFVFSTAISQNVKNKEPIFLIIWLDSQSFAYNYLTNKIKDVQFLPENLKQISLAMVPIKLDAPPIPPEISKYSFSRDITEQISFSKQSIVFEKNYGNIKVYGRGSLLNFLPNYVVFALQEE